MSKEDNTKLDLDFEMTYKFEDDYKYNKIDVSSSVKIDDIEYEENLYNNSYLIPQAMIIHWNKR